MKIGILTYHRVVNDGSVVQAYCLYNLIKSLLPGARVEIIDYRCAKTEKLELKKFITKKAPFFNISHAKKYFSLKRFLKNNFEFSPSITTNNLRRAKTLIDRQRYDAIIVGSDTVWEFRPSKFVPKPPNIYYLPGINGTKKIAFAASSDPINRAYMEKLQARNQVVSCVLDFDFITVRDEPTINYLVEMGIKKERVSLMPDPTLLWRFSELVGGQYEMKSRTKPAAGVALGSPLKGKVSRILEGLGYEIVDFEKGSKTSVSLPTRTLQERLGIYGQINLLVTDRFHGSIFALRLAEIPAIFVETASKWPEPNSKGRDLFNRLGIEDMVLRYEGGSIAESFIKERLDKWPDLSLGLQDKFNDLKDKGIKATRMLLRKL